jgi:adenylate cyclase
MAERPDVLAGDLVRVPVRLVETIGEAAMLVSPPPDALLACALDLRDAADAEREPFPGLRVGAAFGPAVARAGDWCGLPGGGRQDARRSR